MSTALAPEIAAGNAVSARTAWQQDIYRILVSVSSPGRKLDSAAFQHFEYADWDTLLVNARHHSLFPLLAHRLLESADRVTLPSQVKARLRTEFQANLLRNFSLLEEIRRILPAWREEGIAAIPYKGPVLGEQLWGSFALRECSDLDFLVPRAKVDRAGDVLRGLGYVSVAPVQDALRGAVIRNASEEQFRHCESSILLELQWAPAPRTLAVRYDEPALWRRITHMAVGGETVNVPSAEDLVGLLVIHGWKHNWAKLIWIADLAVLLQKHDIDWQQVRESATRDGWRRILLLGLEMVRRVYGVTTALAPDAKLRLLAANLERRLQLAQNNSYLGWHRDMLLARDGRVSQIRQLRNFVFTPGLAEYASAKLPACLSPGYRMVRLARVMSLWPEKAQHAP
jgi:hypothetical protein